MRTRHMLPATLTILLSSMAPAALGVEIHEGWDWILTDPGTQAQIPMLADDPLNPDKWVALSSFPYSNPFAKGFWGDPTPGAPVSVVFQTTWYDPHGAAIPPSVWGAKHAVKQVTTPVEITDGEFDTVISRPTTTSIAGIGTEVPIDIRIDWLSLRSTQPISLQGQSGLFDVYIGVNRSLAQGEPTGRMMLRSGSPSGDSGWINLGDSAVSGDETLGLPVNWIGYFIPHGLDPIVGNAVASVTGYDLFQNHWSTPPDGRSPTYTVPEPASLMTLAAAMLILHRRR